MFTNILRKQLIRRFNHTNIKPTCPENNIRLIEDLLHTQNRNLRKISDEISSLGNCILLMTTVLAFKPMR
jgi:hypothetical protein